MCDERNLENVLDDDDYEDDKNDSMTPQEVVDQIAKGGEQVIIKWHNIILKESPKFDAFLEPANMLKNRYPNVILYDQTRVKLLGDKEGDDYYHASYVDSYDRADNYILAQAPFNETTESDFWRMIIQTGTKLIVLLTDIHDQEGNRLVKHFWPESKANSRSYSETNIKINYAKSGVTPLYDWYNFSISNILDKRMDAVTVSMLHYRKWIDDKTIPDDLLEFRSEVEKNGYVGPVCLLCPTGVHRSGTYAVLDIVLDRVNAEKKVGLLETASIVRKQRYGCMTYYSHYKHIADLIVRYAIATGIVDIRQINRKE
ncbi:unnamed protein product [Onchocerca ochengi]|uniref:Protein tyrosine phosphatase n=1 Tax=Onchocerca ochengi TaxID=42157 RepID=A0A182EL27_ONCOC|nr:unnamed protein product [Onchocerca ochengi]